jgi:hypothetical protein
MSDFDTLAVQPILSDDEHARLVELESQAEQALIAFLSALKTIHDERLYRADYGSFDEYLSQRWNKTRQWYYMSMPVLDASQAYPELTEPLTVRAAHALMNTDESVRSTVASAVARLVEAHKEQITPQLIRVAERVIKQAMATGHVEVKEGLQKPATGENMLQAVKVELDELRKRQLQHIAENARWQPVGGIQPATLEYDGTAHVITLENFAPLGDLVIPSGGLKMRVQIYLEKVDGNG